MLFIHPPPHPHMNMSLSICLSVRLSICSSVCVSDCVRSISHMNYSNILGQIWYGGILAQGNLAEKLVPYLQCQGHRMAYIIKVCLLFTLHASHQTTNYSKTTKSVLYTNLHETKHTLNIKHKIFQELVPLVSSLLKKKST